MLAHAGGVNRPGKRVWPCLDASSIASMSDLLGIEASTVDCALETGSLHRTLCGFV